MTFTSRFSRRAALVTLSFTFLCLAQKDPGVRGGPPGAGGPIQGLHAQRAGAVQRGKAAHDPARVRLRHLQRRDARCRHR